MPQACPNYWQIYGCEWGIRYLWHWTNPYARLDLVVLALLLAYIFAIAIRVSRRYYLGRRARRIDNDGRDRRELVADLSVEVRGLRSIASIAPYLGLVGTCLGLLSLFEAFAMEKHAVQAMLASKAAAALLTTAAGILVAVPATCFYNYLRTLIDLLESELSNEPLVQKIRDCQGARRLRLTKRFSGLPTFALIAAPSLGILVAACLPFSPTNAPTGFGTELPSTRCEYDGDDRLIVLHLTNADELFLNNEQEGWNSLASHLSEIYTTRVHRTLYLVADGEVRFQTVADAIDIIQKRSSSVDITVRLITPSAMNARCL
jgi:biopolymer transport protein ExbD